MNANPYISPVSDSSTDDADASLESRPPLGAIARAVFLAWERLRIAYVVLLGILTLLLSGPSIAEPRVLVLVVGGAVLANLCFFAGPIIETYVRWLGYERKWVRWFLFAGGMLLSMLLATMSLVSELFPNQN